MEDRNDILGTAEDVAGAPSHLRDKPKFSGTWLKGSPVSGTSWPCASLEAKAGKLSRVMEMSSSASHKPPFE